MTKLWKWLFFGLLALNLAFVGVVTTKLLTPVSTETVSTPSGTTKIGTYTMTRSELSDALASFAKDYSTDKMSFTVSVTSSQIVFESKYTLLGYDVPLYIYFTPLVNQSGAIELQVSELSAGSLSLPVSDVLKLIQSSTDLPDYVTIDSKKELVTLNIQTLKNDAGITAHAQSFDLVNNRIEFDIYKSIH